MSDTSPKDDMSSLLYRRGYGWSERLSNLPWSQLVHDTSRIWTHGCLASKLSSFQQAILPQNLKQRFRFTKSLPKQKRGKKMPQFFTFVQYESYPTFLTSFSSPFYESFIKTLQIEFWYFPNSYHHPLRIHSPHFSNLILGWNTVILRPTSMTHSTENVILWEVV